MILKHYMCNYCWKTACDGCIMKNHSDEDEMRRIFVPREDGSYRIKI